MKKTFPANISGKIFYIDEDAYMLLQNYFTQLRTSFPGDEGVEIVSDIEGRVAEIFSDKIGDTQAVITLVDVNEVIARMGRPEQLSDDEGATPVEPAVDETEKEKPIISINLSSKKRLYRNMHDKVFGGVLGGIAEYFNWNSNILRLLYTVAALCTYVGPFLAIYLVLWMVIPPASNSRRILEMKGRPVTVDGVGRTVLDTATPPPFEGSGAVAAVDGGANGFWNFVAKFFRVLGKCAMILLMVIGVVAGVGAVTFIVLGISTLVLGMCFSNFAVAANMGISLTMPLFQYELWAIIVGGLVATIPCIAIIWAACCVLFNKRGASSGLIISAVIIEILLIAALVVLLNLVHGSYAMCALAAAALPSLA